MGEALKVHTSTGKSRPDSSLVLWLRSRRLRTRLNEFGVDAETIQNNPGRVHAGYCILPDRSQTEAAMKRMGTVPVKPFQNVTEASNVEPFEM